MEEQKQSVVVKKEEEDPNSKWSHAISAEKAVKKKEALAQLEYMRELFSEYLPLGEKADTIEKYFNVLEEVIFTKDKDVEYERFEDNQCSGQDKEYWYNSATVFKERSRRQSYITDGERVDHPPDESGGGTTVHDESESDDDF